jgi:hypothetical protein
MTPQVGKGNDPQAATNLARYGYSDEQSLCACRSRGIQNLVRFLFALEIVDRHFHAALCKLDCGRCAYSGACAGNERSPIDEMK